MKLMTLATMACAMLTSLSACAQSNNTLEVSGDLKGLKDTLIVFTPNGEGYKRDTVLVKDGKFAFTTSVSEPADIHLYSPGSLRGEERIGFTLLAMPGEKVAIKGDITTSYYVSGSKFYEEYNEADRANDAAQAPLKQFSDSLSKIMMNGGDQQKIMAEYQAKAPALQKQADEAMLAFIQKHADSEGAAAFITKMSDIEVAKKAAAALSDRVRNGRMKSYYQGYIDQVEAQAKAEAEAAKKQAAGVEAPDFTLNDINGKPLSLSSLRGKYVILDFWGTWCGWCVKGIPQMKEYYEKYKGKFEILSIDCNETEDKWKDGVKKYELPWLNVYQPRQGDMQTTKLYAVQGFPTKILVGPDGKIVKTVVGEDPAFYTFLDETFGK